MRICTAAVFCLLASLFAMQQQESQMASIVERARETYGNFVTCGRKYVVSLREMAYERYEKTLEWVKQLLSKTKQAGEEVPEKLSELEDEKVEEAEEEIKRIIEAIKAKLEAMTDEEKKEFEAARRKLAEEEVSSTAPKEL
jgi:gas vesicle protein